MQPSSNSALTEILFPLIGLRIRKRMVRRETVFLCSSPPARRPKLTTSAAPSKSTSPSLERKWELLVFPSSAP